jgi:hypothetical protein
VCCRVLTRAQLHHLPALLVHPSKRIRALAAAFFPSPRRRTTSAGGRRAARAPSSSGSARTGAGRAGGTYTFLRGGSPFFGLLPLGLPPPPPSGAASAGAALRACFLRVPLLADDFCFAIGRCAL